MFLNRMRIGLIAPPFIAVPPQAYGGTELFVAHLANGLHERSHDVTVYANGDSRVSCHLKWKYPQSDWPIVDFGASSLKNLDHTAWAMHDASHVVDVLHLNDAAGVPFSRFVNVPVVLTLHHPYEAALSSVYVQYPEIEYVAISHAQALREPMTRRSVVYHGLVLSQYTFGAQKRDYLAFLGRMAPCKGAHLAVAAARRAGLPLKLAGEIQPAFRAYWEEQVAPLVDGVQVEYIGEVDHVRKNQLLSEARALLFPIQWDEPFGLAMIEAMACGTPVLAFDGGSVAEIVREGVSGWICRDVEDMAERAASPAIAPESCRAYVATQFSCERMVNDYIALYERLAEPTWEGQRSVAGLIANPPAA
jgi:glycosyltransferase involved in cell wall biosynthesis